MEEVRPSIFIGNGMNIALKELCPEADIKLDYESIFKEVMERLDGNPRLRCFLNKALEKDNKDLEYLLLILRNSDECLNYVTEHYCHLTNNCHELLKKHRDLLKEYVIETLTDERFHPSYENIFSNSSNDLSKNIKRCGDNLKEFERIFTINYDLILYWLLNNQGLLKNRHFQDGFSLRNTHIRDKKIKNLHGISLNNNHPNYFYLHGALHLIQNDNRAYKIVKDAKDPYLNLLDIRNILLQSNLELDSLIIFCGTSDEKISNIISNSYLNKMYDKITPIEGDIIVYGCNFLNGDEVDLGNDIHLWQKIVNSKTKNIYASIGSNELDNFAEKLMCQLSGYKFRDNLDINVYCFSHKDVNIWTSSNFYNEIKNKSSEAYNFHS